MSKKSLSSVDNALLHMDAPNNLMVITGMMTMDAPVEASQVTAVIEERLLCYDRFRQRVVRPDLPFKRPYWQDDPHFDLDRHLVVIERALPEDKELLQYLVSQLMALPLDPFRPLWQIYLVEKYGEGSAIICRFHHCIADGIALMGVLLSLADRAPDSVSESGDVLPPTHSSGNGRVFSGKRRTGVKMLRNPRRAIRLLRQSAETAASMSRFITRRSDPDTVLKGELGGHKQAVWEGPISLDEVKRIGRILGGTVNDVLIAMLAGALRKYMLYHHEKISVNDLHSFVPVNLRSPDSEELLGNQFGFVFLSLPVGVGDPVRRLDRVHEHMNQLKSSNEAIATFGLLHLLGSAPGIQEAALSIVDSKGTAVTTNVPGPREQLYFAGAPINTLMAWVPKSGHVGLGISILSYNGGVYLGIAADDKLVPDPERMLTYFCEEFNLLSKLADEQEISRGSGTAPMLDMLNEALGTLDQILEESQPVAVQEVSLADDRCHGLTKSGRRCKNKALSESEYCYIHVLTDDPDRELA